LTGEDIIHPIPEFIQNEVAEGRISQKEDHIKIYPNPTQDKLNITTNGDDFLLGKSIVIMNYLGKRVLETTIHELHEIVDISRFSNGVYVVLIKDDKKIIEKNVILKVY
jgi:hypothetical protein